MEKRILEILKAIYGERNYTLEVKKLESAESEMYGYYLFNVEVRTKSGEVAVGLTLKI